MSQNIYLVLVAFTSKALEQKTCLRKNHDILRLPLIFYFTAKIGKVNSLFDK